MPANNLEIFIRKNLRFNIAVNMLDAAFFGIALGFGSFGTIIPLFVSGMTPSALLIGLVPSIHAVGWQLPQLFTANAVAKLRLYKPTVLKMTIHERLPFLGFALVAWYMSTIGIKPALVLTFMLLTWQGLGGGFTANAWQSFVAKIIPSESRGTFFGAQAAVANIFISGSAIAAGYLLNKLDSPFDFTLTFLLAFFFLAASWVSLALTREPVDEDKVIPESMPPIWHGALTVMRRDTNFSWFLLVRFLSMFATMGFSFYIVYGLRRFEMSEVVAGYLTAVLTVSQTIANASMGWLGDRIGHRPMLIIGALAVTLSSMLAWFAPTIDWMYPVFILAGVANVAIWTIGMALTVEFGTETERPIYIGLANTLTAPATILAPILGGWVADSFGFQATFGISVFGGLLTAAILWLMVKDPLREAAPSRN